MKKPSLLILIYLIFIFHSNAQNGWSALNSTVNESLLKVQCLSQDTIFLYGDNGVLLKSTDGGNSFIKKQYSLAGIYTSGFFIDTDTGFTAGGTGLLRRTYDGGNNWDIVNACTCFIIDVCFSNSQIGVMSNVGGVYRTDDGGSNWTATPVPYSLNKFVPVSDSIFLAIDDTLVYRMTDAGLNFSVQTVNNLSNAPLAGISFINSQEGYTVSTDGHLFRTTDQGLNWSEVTSNTIIDISNIDFVDSVHGFLIVGSLKNFIYKSIDGGHNWMLDYTATHPIESISHHGGSVYACGQNGLILKKNVSLVGISEPSIQPIRVFVNPSNNFIELSSTIELTGKSFQIFNINGQLMSSGKISPGQNEFDISCLNSGLYLIYISGFDAVRFNLIRN